VFKSPYVQFIGTEFAVPLGPDDEPLGGIGDNFPDQRLEPGESSSIDFGMKAVQAVGEGIMSLFLTEQIARVWVKGELDVDKFFTVWNRTEVNAQIHPMITRVPGPHVDVVPR
jgi:hypothetical protein